MFGQSYKEKQSLVLLLTSVLYYMFAKLQKKQSLVFHQQKEK